MVMNVPAINVPRIGRMAPPAGGIYSPWMGKMAAQIGQGIMGRQLASKNKALKEMAGKALTGDKTALSELGSVNPGLAIQVGKHLEEKNQNRLAQAGAQAKARADQGKAITSALGRASTAADKIEGGNYPEALREFGNVLGQENWPEQAIQAASTHYPKSRFDALKRTGTGGTVVEGFDEDGKFGRFPSNDPKLQRAATTNEKKVVAELGPDSLNTAKGKALLANYNSGGGIEFEVGADGTVRLRTGRRTIGAETKAQVTEIQTEEAMTALLEVQTEFDGLKDKSDPLGLSGKLVEDWGSAAKEVQREHPWIPDIAVSAATGFMVSPDQIPQVAAFRQSVKRLSEKIQNMRSAYGEDDRKTGILLARADQQFGLAMDGNREMFEAAMGTFQEAIQNRQTYLDEQVGAKPAPQAALDALKADPSLIGEFEKKYGYSP